MRRTCLLAITVSVIFSGGLVACRKPPKPSDAQSYYGLPPGTDTETATVQRKAGWTQEKILISHCCSAAPEEKSMLAASSEHFNMVPAWEQTLDFAAKHGVKVMLEHGLLSPGTMQSADKIAELDALIDRVKKHPALEAYYVVDEPKATDFSLLQKMVQHLRERDPQHLAFINMLPISHALTLKPGETHTSLYREFLRRYVKTVQPDLLSYDYYHFFQTKDGKQYDDFHYFLNLSLVREAARAGGIPFMNIIQCSTYLKYWRMPTAAELRWLVYTTLAYGGRGLSYFLYWGPAKYGGLYRDGEPIPLIDSVSKINAEVAILSPALMNLRSTEVYHSEPLPSGTEAVPANAPVQIISLGQFVLGFFENSTGKGSFMIVNRDYRNASRALVKIKGKTRIKEFSRAQGRWIETAADEHNNFPIELEPGDGRLFEY